MEYDKSFYYVLVFSYLITLLKRYAFNSYL